MGAMCVAPAFAANDGCGDEGNDFINRRLALCSTHAYNVGLIENPKTPGERQLMNEAVALKTTIMTQQMKKQYDFLEVTVRRFKTQLEKAILVSQMQAAGASADDSKSSGTGGAQLMSGARDCSQGFNTRDKLQCLQSNYGVIYQSTSSGTKSPSTDARKQIVTDMNILTGLVVYIGQTATYAYDDNTPNRKLADYQNCTKNQTSANANCVTLLQNGIARLIAAQEQSERAGSGRSGY